MNIRSKNIVHETHPMLDPKALPPSPAARMKMHAIILRMRVRQSTSHSWYSLVIKGLEASGISSEMS
jgi:hypothetical protein